MTEQSKKSAEELAAKMHEHYEWLSLKNGWNTQSNCKVVFHELPEENKRVMIGMAEFVIREKEQHANEQNKQLKEENERLRVEQYNGKTVPFSDYVRQAKEIEQLKNGIQEQIERFERGAKHHAKLMEDDFSDTIQKNRSSYLKNQAEAIVSSLKELLICT